MSTVNVKTNVKTIDVRGRDGLRFVLAQYADGIPMPLHVHETEASLNYCVYGAIQETSDGRTMEFGSKSMTLMPAGVPHACRFADNTSTFLVVLSSFWIERIRQVSDIVDTPKHWIDGRPAWLGARMYNEFLRNDDLTPLALEGMLLELVAELARHDKGPGNNDDPAWLRSTMEYVRAHFTETISSKSMAAAAGVHPSHLMRAFRFRHGCTIGEYARRLRVEFARQLLETADIPLSHIAVEAGFCDQGHFGRAFKAEIGVTPGEYQRGFRQHASHVQELQS